MHTLPQSHLAKLVNPGFSVQPFHRQLLQHKVSGRRFGTAGISQDSRAFIPFKVREHGLDWHRSFKEGFTASEPRSVFLAASYAYQTHDGIVKESRKYSSVRDHDELWDCVERIKEQELKQTFHEVIPGYAPRCLYFDLDGPKSLKQDSAVLTRSLQEVVKSVFGYDQSDTEMVILTSSARNKYSEHIIFPKIQFDNHDIQQQYMPVVHKAVEQVTFELQITETEKRQVPLLANIVDWVPYLSFQHFRAPHACKLSDGYINPETELRPQAFLNDNEKSCFVTYCDPSIATPLPTLEDIFARDPELRKRCEAQERYRRSGHSGHNEAMYCEAYQQMCSTGIMDLSGRSDLEIFEATMAAIHPERACQWWSWFRVCGVTGWMLERHGRDTFARNRIWSIHHRWSSRYLSYSKQENEEMVLKSVGKRRAGGIKLLLRLACHDNPRMHIRSNEFDRPPSDAINWHPRL